MGSFARVRLACAPFRNLGSASMGIRDPDAMFRRGEWTASRVRRNVAP